MTIEGAIEWIDANAGGKLGSEAAVLGLAKAALIKWDEMLDIEHDYKACAEESARLRDWHVAIKPPLATEDITRYRCRCCLAYVKATYHYCPKCGAHIKQGKVKMAATTAV